MKKLLVRAFTLMILLSLVITPVLAQGDGPRTETVPDVAHPAKETAQELPQEILAEFEDGMSIEEFLVRHQGPIPNALVKYADLPLTVIVQLEQPSLIAEMQAQGVDPSRGDGFPQADYVGQLTAAQDAVIGALQGMRADVTVMGRYTKVLNGFMLHAPASALEDIRAIAGVKSISRAPLHTIDLSASIPLINADDIQNMSPVAFKGAGITIAVIDTGVDYTHAMFGGLGTADAYALNDPDVLEEGSFPVGRVIGGWDFAGTAYDANTNPIPTPDADPLDQNGHGTHVASTAAGSDIGFGGGVAPEAFIYALKVFGAEGSTSLTVDAIEWATDPNGDGFITDAVDVINMSLGASFGPADPMDPEFIAIEAANAAGTLVVVSSGNAGDVNYVTGSPGNTDSTISVAASTTGFDTLPFIKYGVNLKGLVPYMPSNYNPVVGNILAKLVDVKKKDGTGLLCDITGIKKDALAGKIALIERGTCSFFVKIDNAAALGAVGAIVYNSEAGGDTYISMDTVDSVSGLPAGFIRRSDGLMLKQGINQKLFPKLIKFVKETKVKTFESNIPADSIADFSSRGPRGYDSKLKPEITAPGVNIFAAAIGSGNLGVSYSGTSMAAPHIAGVVALMKQAHPNYTNEEIKAALMNTAVDLVDIGGDVPRQGAGRVDVLAAAETDVVAVGDPRFVSLTWGLIEIGDEMTFEDTKTVTLRNFGATEVTLDIGVSWTSYSEGAGLTPDVGSVTIPAGGTATVDFTLALDGTLLPIAYEQMEEYFGYVVFYGDSYLRLPFHFVPRPYAEIAEIGSYTTFDYDELGYVDMSQTGPVASSLWAYPLMMSSADDPTIENLGDLRAVGLDYGWTSAAYGDIFIPAFAMYGSAHTLQPYWGEVDMYIDGDQDGAFDVVNFNYNYGALTTSYPDNTWVVLQVDFNDGGLYLASPYTIYTDFNSGFQEWYLPASWSYVVDTFTYAVMSYDWYGTEDFVGIADFDITQLPMGWVPLDYLTWSIFKQYPHNELFSLVFYVSDVEGFQYAAPEGIMMVDYNGRPGLGEVYTWPLTVNFP